MTESAKAALAAARRIAGRDAYLHPHSQGKGYATAKDGKEFQLFVGGPPETRTIHPGERYAEARVTLYGPNAGEVVYDLVYGK